MHFIQLLKNKDNFHCRAICKQIKNFLNDLINFVIVVQLADFAFEKKERTDL